MMKKILFLFCLYFYTCAALAQRNVVLIIADDLGTDYFGFYSGHQDTVGVPHLRSLADNGVTFTNATSNPFCSATRAGILTGRYGFRTGVGGVVGASGGALDTAEVSIPKMLELYDPSIAKANIGKWHLNNPMPAINLMSPQALGYDHFEGPFIGALTSFTNWTKYINGTAVTVTNYATTENVDNAVSWVQAQSGQPFFLWLAFNAPHSPYHLPPLNLHSYTGLPGTQPHINQNPKLYFKAAVQSMDTEIGRLLDSLQSMGRLDSTDIIFIGDNGNSAQTAQIPDTSKAKGTVYEYGVHVPMIVSGPSVVNPGRASDVLVNTNDIFATVLEMVGFAGWQNYIPAGVTIDSRSMMPVLLNTNTPMRNWAFTEVFDNTPDSAEAKAIRDDRYKLIQFYYGNQEFYDLLNDTLQNNNLLQGTLSASELTRYQYLCSEMSALTGGTFCNTGTGIEGDINHTSEMAVYPNPFDAHITAAPTTGTEWYELSDSFGRLIHEGTDIASRDFSSFPPGFYLLRIFHDESVTVHKLLHR
jgi:arylsulfatase A-like enzyme